MQRMFRLLLVTMISFGGWGVCAADQVAGPKTVYDISELNHRDRPVLLSRVNPEYPAQLKEQGITGEALVSFVIDTDGKVTNAAVTGATRVEFAAPAFAAVQQWKFRPGRKNGHPVNTRVEVTIPFTRDKR